MIIRSRDVDLACQNGRWLCRRGEGVAMRLLIDVRGGESDENRRVVSVLAADPRTRQARVRTIFPPPRPETLGAAEVIEFVGQNVLLPLTVQALYDYLKSRWGGRAGQQISVTITRTDLPDGARHETVSISGDVDAVVAALRSAE
ncbi:effector-associated constant component EACC1 [Micromonospora haikouensis]|uniref:effector-associated constant component EACC1 n=1 Tax=Micromonospora haikouensis TaxID=686309 RepID=UPI00118741B9|nr:hypothetical protein [Micromonospora haikouensis]